MDPTMTFAERLAMQRKRARLSQAKLAAQVGVAQNTISQWEKGRTTPAIPELHKLCKVFGVSADYLCAISDYPSGLAPDSWLVDLDSVAHPRDGETWCVKVPRRVRVVDYVEMLRIEKERTAATKTQRRAKDGGA